MQQGYFLPLDEFGCELKMITTLQPRMVGIYCKSWDNKRNRDGEGDADADADADADS